MGLEAHASTFCIYAHVVGLTAAPSLLGEHCLNKAGRLAMMLALTCAAFSCHNHQTEGRMD